MPHFGDSHPNAMIRSPNSQIETNDRFRCFGCRLPNPNPNRPSKQASQRAVDRTCGVAAYLVRPFHHMATESHRRGRDRRRSGVHFTQSIYRKCMQSTMVIHSKLKYTATSVSPTTDGMEAFKSQRESCPSPRSCSWAGNISRHRTGLIFPRSPSAKRWGLRCFLGLCGPPGGGLLSAA